MHRTALPRSLGLLAARRAPTACARALTTVPAAASTSAPAASPAVPWFVDPAYTQRANPPHLAQKPIPLGPHPALPTGVPDVLRTLHAALAHSPHLEPATLLVRKPIETPPGPPLPFCAPKGRRMRGGTESGEGVDRNPGVPESGGIWSWIVIAQVKEGTEKRGAIESVVRLVRKTLLKAEPPLPLPPNCKKRINDSWAMIDAGEFAVHVLSRTARESFFVSRKDW